MVLIIGTIAAAVTPIFSGYLVRSREEAFKFLSNILNLFLIILIIVSLILIIFAPQILSLIAPGFTDEKKELTVLLTRIMFLSPFLLGISNVISSVLRVFKRFLITSLSPIMYNLGIIFGILFFVPTFGISGLAWGVALGGFLHLLIQIPILFKTGFKFQKILDFKDKGFLEVIKLTIPRSLGLAATQINLIVITNIASKLTSGSIAAFNLADNLSRPLLTLIGISFSTAAFPTLALSFSIKNKEKFNKVYNDIFNKIILFILPSSIFLFIFREIIVKIIFKVGAFGTAEVNLTAACLGMFALGLFAQSLIMLIAKAFYAFQNTIIPAVASITGMIINIILCPLFVKLLSFPNSFHRFLTSSLNLSNLTNIEAIGLPLAVSISAIFQLLILLILFWRKRNSAFSNS